VITLSGYHSIEKLVFRWADQCGEFRDKDHQIPGFPDAGQNFGHVWTQTLVEDKGLEALLMDWYYEVKNVMVQLD
jgi:hypothetical protein